MDGSGSEEDLISLYQEIILDHGKNPRNKGCVDNHTCRSEGRNPLCGDRVTVTALIEDEVIKDLRFDGKGCAISMASASMMTDSLIGVTRQQARNIFDGVKSLCSENVDSNQLASMVGDTLEPRLTKLMALSGVRNFPVRVKCATLPWQALMSCLEGKETATTEKALSPAIHEET